LNQFLFSCGQFLVSELIAFRDVRHHFRKYVLHFTGTTIETERELIHIALQMFFAHLVMKIEKNGIGVAIFLFLISLVPTFAVDELQISVQAANAVLAWPSLTNETYVVQYRNSLDATDAWVTLNGNLTSADGTNLTFYTDPNTINYPISFLNTNTNSISSGGGAPLPNPSDTNTYSGGSSYDWIAGTGFYRVLGVRVIDGITNGATVSDYLNIMTRPDAGAKFLSLTVDGKSFPNQIMLAPPFTNADSVTFTSVDTASLSNGVHTLQVKGAWYVPAEANLSSGYEYAYSQPITIYVTNELSYPEWNGYAGDGWTSFHMQSAHLAVDWEVDVYNYYDYLYWYYGYTDSVYPIHVATGSTTNGMIDYLWNLTDDSNNLRTNLYNDPDFFSFTYTSWTSNGGLTDNNQFHANTPDGGGSAQKPNPMTQNDNWPSEGGYWVVAWQDMLKNAYDDGNLMQSEFNGWLSMASEANPIFYQTPTGGTNAQTWPIRYNDFTNTAFINTNDDYSDEITDDILLLNTMLHDSRSRNFYGFGHGADDYFMGLWLLIAQGEPMTRYCFVWLDGCETATGQWDDLFHLKEAGVRSLDYYQTNHLRPGVFMGHTREVPYAIRNNPVIDGVHYDGTIPDSVPFFRSQFVFYWWLENYSLKNALNEAIFTTPDAGFSSGYQLGDYLQVEGYDQMGWDDYNDAGYSP
jgi:hypothetical protein